MSMALIQQINNSNNQETKLKQFNLPLCRFVALPQDVWLLMKSDDPITLFN